MDKTSISTVITLLAQGAEVSIDASRYTDSELITLAAQASAQKRPLTLRNAGRKSDSTLITIAAQGQGHVRLEL